MTVLPHVYQVVVRSSAIHRNGCFAGEPIPAGALIREYTGEVISVAEALRRDADLTRPGIYTMRVTDERVIDGWIGGNESIYINHCCTPNCSFKRIGEQVFIVALQALSVDEELTLDYAYDPEPPLEPCLCGSPQCRGYINDLPVSSA